MNDLRLNRKDGVFIAVCLLVLLSGLLVSLRYFRAAFPEASIGFRYNRAQSGHIAGQFAHNIGWQIPESNRHASRFGYDDLAKTYLEKELGVEGARAYLGKPVRLWFWQHRWFRPATKEEFQIFVTPEGDVVRADHEIPEDAAGADLPEDSARHIAEHFLFGVMRQDSSALTFIESERIGRPHRADWTFTYRATGIEPVEDSEYRYSVQILGDQPGSYRERLKVPEEWLASYSKLRSYNQAAGQADFIGIVLTLIAIFAVFFIRSRRKDIRWRIALKFGIVAAALVALNQINDFPQTLYGYMTEDSWSGFLVTNILSGLIAAIGAGAGIFLLTAAAEPLYRERYGDKLSLSQMFTARGLRTKQAFKNILLGITLTSFFFAYQIVFYLVAQKFGAWSPSDVPYDNLLNTAMPWLAVLAVGFFPAVSEEFTSRMFSIPFLQKAFKNRMTWLALLIPAVIWGFGHAGYANQPWWIRGAEVGIAGMIIGMVMLKWGILAALVWHYTVDAMYTAFLLFRSDNLYFISTAAVATGLLVIPLLLALIAYLRKGSFLPDEGARNADEISAALEPIEAPPAAKPMEAPVITYRKLPNRNRLIGVGILIAGIIAAIIPVEQIGKFLEYPVRKQDAVSIFADSLRKTGWADPDTLKMAAFINDDGDVSPDDPFVYLLKHSRTIAEFNQLADERLDIGRWRVNAWVPENRLQFTGTVHARSGQIVGLYPILPEEMAGDSLSKESAQAMVERALMNQGEDTSALVLQEYRDFDRPQRLDHSFTYEAKEGDPRHIAEAKYRRSGRVDGDYLSVGRRPWYKIPETWERARNATTAVRAVREWLTYLLIAAAIVWAIMLLGFRARQGLVPWKRALLVAIVPAGISLLSGINHWYLLQAEYFHEVEVPLTVFRTTGLISILTSTVVLYIFYMVGLAFLGALYPDKLQLLRRHERQAGRIDTWVAVAAGLGFVLITGSTANWLDVVSTKWITFSGWNIPDWIAAPLPFLAMLDNSLQAAMLGAGFVALIVYTWNGPLRKPLHRALLLVAMIFLTMSTNAPDPGEWLYEALSTIPAIALVWFTLNYVIAGRTATFFAAAFAAAAYYPVSRTLHTGNGIAIIHAWIFIFIALIILAVWWAPVWGKRRLPVD